MLKSEMRDIEGYYYSEEQMMVQRQKAALSILSYGKLNKVKETDETHQNNHMPSESYYG